MNEKIKCEIIQDLLPSYVDGLTSEVTNETVNDHLKACADCRKVYERMNDNASGLNSEMHLDADDIKVTIKEKIKEKEIDFLRKTRKNNRCKIITGMILVAVVSILIAVVNIYFVGESTAAQSVVCQVTVDGNLLKISGTVTDSAKGISDITFEEEDGVVHISFKSVMASAFHSGDFNTQYIANAQISQVRIGDRILWDQGTKISNKVSDVFNASHPYIGEMPANGKSSQALEMGSVLGSFKNELHTDAEPYGWTMDLEEIVSDEDYEYKTEMMIKYSMVLLATIDNLSYVTFEYETENGSESCRMDLDIAANYLHCEDVKSYGDSPASLQKLMQRLHLE